MERGWMIVLGASCSFIALFIIFWIFDKILQAWLRNRHQTRRKTSSSSSQQYQPLRQKFQDTVDFGFRRNPQVHDLLTDPYRSDEHEVIAIVAQDRERDDAICDRRVVAGMSALLNDGVIHWFIQEAHEELDTCTAILCAMEAWGRHWQGAEMVSFLCEDKQVVKDYNVGRLHPFEALTQLEIENNFTLNFQWSENFHCHDPDFQDLMESFPQQIQHMVSIDPSELDELPPMRIWSGFLLSHWDMVKVGVDFGTRDVPVTEDLAGLFNQPEVQRNLDVTIYLN